MRITAIAALPGADDSAYIVGSKYLVEPSRRDEDVDSCRMDELFREDGAKALPLLGNFTVVHRFDCRTTAHQSLTVTLL